ncbi:unnamed protein product [Blepharisma stoltei]|uniref:Uncharacterized protein n=1 Tax=Blepharisma stoltei TaxID=1481888 RepID=A0AAU9JSQ6_9CILI|nr:unnamed protein product [Blepharisma stoltei]
METFQYKQNWRNFWRRKNSLNKVKTNWKTKTSQGQIRQKSRPRSRSHKLVKFNQKKNCFYNEQYENSFWSKW